MNSSPPLLDALNAALAVWRVDATADSGHRLVDALDQTLSSLRMHLDDEERQFLPLLEQHISAAEPAIGFRRVGRRRPGRAAAPVRNVDV